MNFWFNTNKAGDNCELEFVKITKPLMRSLLPKGKGDGPRARMEFSSGETIMIYNFVLMDENNGLSEVPKFVHDWNSGVLNVGVDNLVVYDVDNAMYVYPGDLDINKKSVVTGLEISIPKFRLNIKVKDCFGQMVYPMIEARYTFEPNMGEIVFSKAYRIDLETIEDEKSRTTIEKHLKELDVAVHSTCDFITHTPFDEIYYNKINKTYNC